MKCRFFSEPCIRRPYHHNTMMPHVIYRCRLTKDLLVNESIHAEIPTVHGKVVVALDMHDAAGEMP